MSKLIYPSDGIYRYSKAKIDVVSNNLVAASNGCSFDIPSDFNYRSYLLNLNNTIRAYIAELDSIESKLQRINNNFENLEDDLSSDVKKMTETKIKDRDRMIV